MSLACNKISGTFELEDDSTTKFEWGIRVALKAPNAPMQDYWDQIPNNVSHNLDLSVVIALFRALRKLSQGEPHPWC